MATPLSSINVLRTPLSTHRLSGKVAIITSGGGKVGIETAGRFLREGANVALVDSDASALDAAVNELSQALSTGEALTSRILAVVADAADEAGVQHYVQLTVRTFGHLDIAFLNWSTSYPATSLLETSADDYETVMRTNVKSAFLGIKHAALAMKELGSGGSIILNSSTAGLTGTPGFILSSGSKFALRGLALTSASELGQYGIRVNTIHPSDEDTPLFRNAGNPENHDGLQAAIPLGRFSRVDDVGSVVAFLASEDSKFISGGSLKIDGGCFNF